MTHKKIFRITPIPKPRMTRRDKIPALQSPSVQKYFAYKDEILWHCKKDGFLLPVAGSHIIYNLPFPKSISRLQKENLQGQGHQKKPDIDNLLKGTLDIFFKNDSCVWNV